MKIDWALLREQKNWLLTHTAPQADGLIALLDHLQDQAVESGQASEAEVFALESALD